MNSSPSYPHTANGITLITIPLTPIELESIEKFAVEQHITAEQYIVNAALKTPQPIINTATTIITKQNPSPSPKIELPTRNTATPNLKTTSKPLLKTPPPTHWTDRIPTLYILIAIIAFNTFLLIYNEEIPPEQVLKPYLLTIIPAAIILCIAKLFSPYKPINGFITGIITFIIYCAPFFIFAYINTTTALHTRQQPPFFTLLLCWYSIEILRSDKGLTSLIDPPSIKFIRTWNKIIIYILLLAFVINIYQAIAPKPNPYKNTSDLINHPPPRKAR